MEHLIIKYINREISEEELTLLKENLKNPEVKKQLKDYLELESSILLSFNDIDVENIYRSLESSQLTSQTKVKRLSTTTNLIKYAAAIVLLIGLATSLKLFLTQGAVESTPDATIITLKLEDGTIKEFNEKEAIISVDDFTPAPPIQATENTITIHYNEINVPYGKKATIKLSDDSQVVLNSGSIFKYPSSFTHNIRKVTLEGEAYFTVTKNVENPFIVETNQMNIEVLGTEFNLSCFNDDNQTTAVLVEGSIRAESTFNNTSLTIKPGEAAISKNENLTVGKVDIQKHTAWLHGDLLFIDDTFETVLKKLERHFNVTIINNNPSLNRVRYNGRFNTETIEQILDAFKVNTAFEYEIENNQIIIKNQTPMK